MTEDRHLGHFEITGKMERSGGSHLKPFDIQIKLDGKTLHFVQSVELTIDASNNIPILKLVILPEKLTVDLENMMYDIQESKD